MPSNITNHSKDYQAILGQGRQARETGNVAQALELFKRAAELAADAGERADALSLVGRCYGTMGDFSAAHDALNEALQLAAGLPSVSGRVKLQAGTVHSLQGQLDSAKQFLLQSVSELRQQGDQAMRLRALGNLGLVLLTRGEYQRAISTYKDAIELGETLKYWYDLAFDYNNLGECYQDLGDLAQAQETHERAIAMTREHELGEYPKIDALRNLGVDLLRMGQVDNALQAIEQALQMARALHQNDLELQGLISLGEVYMAQNEYDKAEEIAKQLIEASAGVPVRLAGARWILGLCYLARGEALQAVKILEAGLINAQASYSKIWILRLHAALGQVAALQAIADVHRRIAAELVQQIADSLNDKALCNTFLHSPLAQLVL